MYKGKEIPSKELLPHFLKLVLQNQVDSKNEEEEARLKSELEKNEEEVEELEVQTSEEDVFHVFKHFSTISRKTGHEEVIKEPTKLDLSIQGNFYLDKEIGRRNAKEIIPGNISEALHRRWSRVVWRKELNNIEPLYRLPVLILRQYRYIKNVEPTRIGPGTYDLDYYQIQKNKRNKTTRGILTTCTNRFPKEKLQCDPTPGPGSYGDPYETYDKAMDKCKHSGKITLFQSGPCNVRTVMAVTTSYPGPGKYSFKSGIQELLSKKISPKGPYELYTPSREIIPSGYYKTQPPNPLGPGQYNIRTSLKQEFNNCCNSFKGKFCPIERNRKVTGERISIVSRLWPTPDDFPGPANYIREPLFKESKQFKYGFNSSDLPRPIDKSSYEMSPDKYRPELIEDGKSSMGRGWESNFISRSKRLDLLKIAVISERLRGKDIPHHQREPYTQPFLDVNKIHCSQPPWKY